MIGLRKREVNRVILISLVPLMFLITISSVSALNGCYIDVDTYDCSFRLNPLFGYSDYGYVSDQGHFIDTPTASANFPYPLCCPDFWPLGYGSGSFEFSTVNDTGHISVEDSIVTNFAGTQYLGTYECEYVTGGDCPADKACVFKMSNQDNSHMMDCSKADTPTPNNYQDKLCCKPFELCWDNLDNDEDGFIDCADSECNGLNMTTGVRYKAPELCTDIPTGRRTDFDTDECVVSWTNPTADPLDVSIVWNPDCIGEPDTLPGDTHYYCSFGHRDRFVDVTSTPGYCCAEGYEYSASAGDCVPTNPCGTDCNQDFNYTFSSWYANHYPTAANWCNSIIPELYSPDTTPTTGIRSDACCLLPKFGEVNNYVDEDNVHVW